VRATMGVLLGGGVLRALEEEELQAFRRIQTVGNSRAKKKGFCAWYDNSPRFFYKYKYQFCSRGPPKSPLVRTYSLPCRPLQWYRLKRAQKTEPRPSWRGSPNRPAGGVPLRLPR
jgi:hypothetical protein